MQKQKRVCVILIATIVITSAFVFGVINIMNSPKIKMVSIIQKIPKIQKGEGAYTIDTKLRVSEDEIAVGIQDGTLLLMRETKDQKMKSDKFLQAKGTVYAKANDNSKLRLGAKYLNGEKGEWFLTNQYTLKSFFLNQQMVYQLDDVLKNELAKVFVISTNENVAHENQEESLQTFLLKGYEPQIGEEQHKPTIVITESEIEIIIQKIENNVRTNRQKFIELVQRQYSNMNRSQIENVATYLADGNFSKDVSINIFRQVPDFYFKIMFEEKARDVLNIETEFKYIGMTTILGKKIDADIFTKTSMNYTVFT